MRTTSIALFGIIAGTAAAAHAQETPIEGSAAAIRSVVSGKTCVGDDILRFAEIGPGASGVFERTGHAAAIYAVGNGTILIERDGKLHSHVTSVSVRDHMLYMSTSRYRC
jgi:hypothetical protein